MQTKRTFVLTVLTAAALGAITPSAPPPPTRQKSQSISPR
jgi:hypothetical protein